MKQPKRIKVGTYIPRKDFDPTPYVMAGVMGALAVLAIVHFLINL